MENQLGTLLHIFWECPKLNSFWSHVGTTIKTLTGGMLNKNPVAFLLNKKFKNCLLSHLLAKACIPALWKSTCPPTIAHWCTRVADIHVMENLTMTLKEQEDKYWKI